MGYNSIKQHNLLWRYPSLFLNKSFSGYLQGNLLWSYLNAMFTEYMRGTWTAFAESLEGGMKRIEPQRTGTERPITKAELAGSSFSSSEERTRAESSPDPEKISTHPLPRETPTQCGECEHSLTQARAGTGKLNMSHTKEKGLLHSKKRRYSNDGPLHRRILRFEARRRIGVRRKVRVQLNELSRESPPSTNFSTVSPFEREGLTDLRDNDLEAIPAEMLSATDGEDTILPDLQHLSDPDIRRLAKDLCDEYPDLFRKTVSSMEARVRPFSLKVDHDKWRTKGNRLPPRRMDNTRENELRRQIELLLRLGVIRESTAGHYSHGFVVPKPGEKWRLVLDFKNLNRVSEIESGWGIPNIQDIMKRLGSHRPKFFAVMDLTAGFHQTPIAEGSREFTAFKTPWGLYEWCRLPMGLKGAPAYFQGAMATEVLNGLIMNICELYLDDVIVYADTAQELESRLRRCFERFRLKGITLNPSKCKLFVPSVEYCGHLIDKEALHFTRSKLDSVTDFAIPETQQGLRSFLGLANWFRDHVNDHSRLVRPLHTMLNGYSKHKRLIWTQDLIHSFESVKRAIHECPKLFFLHDTSPIYVHTDASQYGMGAYLFQVRDGIQYPIRFISKAFDDRMSRWSTMQQEGYAIYYAITEWDFLLRDRRFTLRTDHDNLTMLKEESNAKVVRWMLALQAYDFEVEHIKGSLNIVADGLSRLCPDKRLQNLGNKSTAIPNSFTKTGSAL